MAKTQTDQPVTPSLLDRLIDEYPDETRERPRSRNQAFRDFKQTVCRDLENLLNTHQRCVSCPQGLDELKRSVLTYGIPDIRAAELGTDVGRQQFARLVEEILRTFEPRFLRVKVDLADNTDPIDRTLRFRIEALLRVEPAPEPVVFDSAIEPSTGNVEVRGTGR
ncbi:MAG: type VI secretion system baseplate subunit TssE [Thermoguttaceae bacterium]|jgi:type VI secretion system protein ImpF